MKLFSQRMPQFVPQLIPQFRLALAAVSAVFLLACSTDDVSTEAKKPAGVIPQHQLKTLQRAEATEDLLLEADKKRQQQLSQ